MITTMILATFLAYLILCPKYLQTASGGGNQSKLSKLKDEIRQVKPFESVRAEAYVGLQRTADLVSRPVEKVFSRWKLTTEQYNVLRIQRGAEPEGLPTLEIGRRMITRASNVTRIIDRLEIKAYVVRRRETQDRRVVRIRISDSGLKLLTDMDEDVVVATATALGGVTDAEAKTLNGILEKLREGVQDFHRR